MKSRQSSPTPSPTITPGSTSSTARGSNAARQDSLGLGGAPADAGSGDLLELLPTLGPMSSVVLDALPPEDGRRIASLLRDVPDVAAWLQAQGGDRGGSPLPHDLAAQAQASLGVDVSDTRVHTDAASGTITDDLGVEALTDGKDLHFAPGAWRPDDPHGRFVILHELAHVAAANGVGGGLDQNAGHEAGADEAAGAMMRGETAEIGSAPAGLRGFGASTHEEITTTGAGNAGMTEAQAQEIYRGNWQRDVTASVCPMTDIVSPAVLAVLDILSRKKFGVGIEEAALGTYDPVEHIDNPAEMDGTEVWDQSGVGPETATDHKPMGTDVNGIAVLDERYDTTGINPDPVSDRERSDAYMVDESGLPAYMIASRDLLHEQLAVAVELGGDSAGHDSGAESAGDATHILQDYYAHSNFCEIAINLLVAEGQIANVEGSLDTHVHAVDEEGNVEEENLRTSTGREVMATSTFTTADTAYSVLNAGMELLEEFDPFKQSSSLEELLVPVLSWVEDSPEYMGTLGDVLAIAAQAIGQGISPLLSTALATATTTHTTLGTIETTAYDIEAGIGTAVTDTAAAAAGLVGDEDTAARMSQTSADIAAEAEAKTAVSESDTARMVAACVTAQTELAATTEALSSGAGGLTALAEIVAGNFVPMMRLSTLVQEIPVVGPTLVQQFKDTETAIQEKIRSELEDWWSKTRDSLHESLEAAIHAVAGPTEVEADPDAYNGEAANSMTAPSHTGIAKDFHHEGPEEAGTDLHTGAELTGIAQLMATNASTAVLTKLQDCWEGSGMEGLDALDAEVDRWFAHPEDCRDTWESTFLDEIATDTALAATIAERAGTSDAMP